MIHGQANIKFIKHFFNYTNKKHNIYYLHAFTVFFLYASAIQICKYLLQGGSNMTGTDLCVRLYKSVPVIFEPACTLTK